MWPELAECVDDKRRSRYCGKMLDRRPADAGLKPVLAIVDNAEEDDDERGAD